MLSSLPHPAVCPSGPSEILSPLDLKAETDTLKSALLERLELIQSRGDKIQSQPLGFMRLALGGQMNAADGQFMHIWMPDLPTQRGGPFLHTHVFDLTSRIYSGKIRDIIFESQFDENGSHVIVGASCAQDFCMPSDLGRRANLWVSSSREFGDGEIYTIPEGVFHQTELISPRAITIMEKSKVRLDDPLLAIPVGIEVPNEPFKRDQIDQEWAWTTVKRMVSEV